MSRFVFDGIMFPGFRGEADEGTALGQPGADA